MTRAAALPDGPGEVREIREIREIREVGQVGELGGTGSGELSDELADLRALYQLAPCGYLTTTDDGIVTRVNDTFLAWTGHTRDALLGAQLHTLLPVGDQILYTSHCMPQLGTSGAVAEVLVHVIGADRVRRPALLTAARTPPVGDRAALVRVIIFSAHERRRYEQELVSALRRAEESEVRRAAIEADMRHLALHDPLTGLLNRAGLDAHLGTGARADADTAGCRGRSIGVLFIDLDHFKAVNDSLGHAAGDELLTVLADRLRSAPRATSTLARLSGDAFVVVDDLDDVVQASHLARRLLAAVTAPVTIQGLEIVISASIGAAVATSDDAPERLLHQAEVAMYRAKAQGRNRIEIHDSTYTDPVVDRLRLLGDLRRGIELGELRVHYQPQINLRDGTLSGVEALVRWEHPDRGLLLPDEFIEAAEASGLIRGLGAWVLNEAVAQAARWADAAPDCPPIRMAVNLSTRQLGDPDLVAAVAEILHRHGIDPALLTLEVTETALIQDATTSLATLVALKDLGIELAVDDFGTGYASLTYLQRFPVDELKIDRSFVSGLGANDGDSAIVATCVQLAHAMNISAVAEGVETEQQRQALIDLDCDVAQGYHYARPLSADAFSAWVTHHRKPAQPER